MLKMNSTKTLILGITHEDDDGIDDEDLIFRVDEDGELTCENIHDKYSGNVGEENNKTHEELFTIGKEDAKELLRFLSYALNDSLMINP